MKIANITHGPVTLSKIDYSPRLSQETVAFAAVITINGLSSTVQNEGYGGPNSIDHHAVHAAVAAYAKTLPPYVSEDGEIAYDVDFLISMMIDDAITRNETAKVNARMIKKGFTHRVDVSERETLFLVFVAGTSETSIRERLAKGKYAAISPTAKITQINNIEVLPAHTAPQKR